MTDRFKDHLRVIALIVLAAVATSGAYGMLHNQVSYTISPEFFTCFKFVQFKMKDSALPERLRASMVGFGAAWWIGLIAGVVIAAASGIHDDPRARLRAGVSALTTVLGCTLLVAAAGLALAIVRTGDAEATAKLVAGGPFGQCVTDPVAFERAGALHNASYLGGFAGLALALLLLAVGWIQEALRA